MRGNIQKTIFYILIQLFTLWSIFNQLTIEHAQTVFDTIGLVILVSVFLLYAYKTIHILSHCHMTIKKERSELSLQS